MRVRVAASKERRQRKQAYERWVLSAVPDGEWERIREAVKHGHLTGKHQLEEEVAERLGVKLEMKKPGRPKKSVSRKED